MWVYIKEYCFKFQSIQDNFVFTFFVLLYIKWLIVWTSMVIKISIGTVMRNAEMLKLATDHLKTKKICKYAVKKLSIKICS